MNLQTRVILVPGATRPIGRAIARRFGHQGARLVLPVFNDWPESTNDLEHEFTDAGFQFDLIPCDLTCIDQVIALRDRLETCFGRLHCLVNNIERGGMPIIHGSYDKPVNRQQWELEQKTTLDAKFHLFHHLLPLLKRAESAAVINISSIAGHIGRSGPAAQLFSDGYSAANRAISSFTETWARQAAPSVRVNEIMIGLFNGRHGEGTRGWKQLSAGERTSLIDHTLLKRLGTPDELADLVYYLAVSATYMTGSVIRFDGGYPLGGDPGAPLPPGILPE